MSVDIAAIKQMESDNQDAMAQQKLKAWQDSYALAHLFEKQNRALLKSIPTNADILEVGCGIGNFLLDALDHTSGTVKGFDLSPECVNVARKVTENRAELWVADGESGIEVADASIDCVVLRGVIHHLAEPLKMFDEVRRVLRPGGRFLAIEGNPSSLWRKIVLGTADRLGMQHEASHFEHRSPGALRGLYEATGYEQIATRTLAGCWAPVAHMGLGRKWLWKILDGIEKPLFKIGPRVWGWWVIASGVKPGEEADTE